MQTMQELQLSFEDLIKEEEKEEMYTYDDLKYGDFEYLKYLKIDQGANEKPPKKITFGYVPDDGIRNLLKLDGFIKKLQKQSQKKPEFNVENYKDTFLDIFGYRYNYDIVSKEEFYESFEVKQLSDVLDEGRIRYMGISTDDNVVCVKCTAKMERYSWPMSFITMINLDNTFKKSYSIKTFKWRKYTDFFDCGIFSINYSLFGILHNALRDHEKGLSDDEVNSDINQLDKTIAIRRLDQIFKNAKKARKTDLILGPYLEKAIIDYKKYINVIDNLKMESEDIKLYAKAFQTKKYIKKETKDVMNNNNFLKNFAYVEIDNTTDLNKFDDLSRYFLEYRKLMPNILPSVEDKVDFRVRRLGNYRALGVYFPMYDTIAVDVDGVESFVHECGHWLETKKLNNLSLSDEFIKDFVMPFENTFLKLNAETPQYPITSIFYWCSAKEVFARAFEIFIKNKYFKNMSCPFLKTDERYANDIAYTWFFQNIDKVNDYFERIEDSFK